MELRFFPLDFDYQLREGKPFIYLYGKLEDNTKICVIQEHQPYFYAQFHKTNYAQIERRLKELIVEGKDGPAKITSWEIVEKELLGKKEEFFKIYVNYPKAVPLISKELSDWGLDCYERDIPFIHRYLRDKNILPFSLVEAKGKFILDQKMRVPLFEAEEIKPFSNETPPKFKILALDIETYSPERIEINPEKNPILMIAFYGIDEKDKEFRKVLTWKKFRHKLDYLETVSDEVELLQRFRQIILDYQPDILTGYFSDGFDLPYLHLRAEKYKIKLDLGLDYSELETGSKSDFREGKSRITGILHLDNLKFIRNIFGKNLKTESYSLDAVSEELLGHRKHQVKISELAHTWDHLPDKLEDYCEYNLHDAHLALQLCQKLLPDMIEFTKIIGIPTFDLIRMSFSKLVENYILKSAMEHNVLAPNRPGKNEIDLRMDQTYEGGFVYEPTPGLYSDLAVFDFRSLYPTIITAHNIGPESLNCSCCELEKRNNVPGETNYWFCARKKSFLSKLLERLILIRVDLKRTLKEAKANGEDTKMLESRSYAIKTLANSFYGYTGFFGARWYCLECAKATTAYARDYIKKTIEKAQQKGFEVVYADTDSCFLLLKDKHLDPALEFMNEVNFDLPGHMELEFEGYYPKGIFVAAKGSEKGAKKRYALISENGKIKITGFEIVRRNSSPLAKEVQMEVLKLILIDKKEEALFYLKGKIKELLAGQIAKEKLVIKTQITRELSSYTSIGPHVAVALKMLERGINIFPGVVIEYIIAKGSGLIRERAKLPEEVKDGEYDSEYYLHHQVLPAISGIFAVLGYKEEDLYKDSSQTGLGQFF